jgi:hypothetical protein
MRLQKQLSRKSGSIIYPKWVVVIPPEKIKEADWKEGTELEAIIKDGKITLVPKKSTK